MNSRRVILSFALLAALVLNASAVMRYVDLNSPSPTLPYTNWLTAATNIQDAIDAAVDGDLILVTNGIYATGGQVVYGALTNRVVINKPITLQSANGASATIIQGYQVPTSTNGDSAVRCVYMTNSAVLNGFTLTSGATRISGNLIQEQRGGGVWCESTNSIIVNCIISDNRAYEGGGGVYRGSLKDCSLISNSVYRVQNSFGGGANRSVVSNCVFIGNTARVGGGAAYCTKVNCVFYNNSADFGGGGAAEGTAYGCLFFGNTAVVGGGYDVGAAVNCTIVSNSASSGGGIRAGRMTNCIVYYNSATFDPDYTATVIMENCCTTPLLAGVGNFTNEPSFVNLPDGDFHLLANSPCINAGNNACVASSTDLDGNPRISGGTVDIGAYEFQSPASVLSYAWAQQNGLPTDGSADFTDADGDGANNWQEWRADTLPTNTASALLMGTATNGVTGLVVSWASVDTRSYWLERGADLGAASPFQIIATNLPGVAGTKTFNDTSATNGGPYFYRVGVQ